MAKVFYEKGELEINSHPNQQNKNFLSSDDEKSILIFINNWISGKKNWILKTSGSTGFPKSIYLERERMIYSARETIKALDLNAGSNSLLAINPNFIGGRMMLVRSILNNMNIVVKKPSSFCLRNLDIPIEFAAFVPLQINSFLQDKEQKENLNNIKKVIVGGAPLGKSEISAIQSFKANFWQTYGMTETYSHIALKKLNGLNKSSFFSATGDVTFQIDPDNRLIINGTITGNKSIITNDLVNLLDEKNFEWTGRYDYVINSGGIKISPEILEDKIEIILKDILNGKKILISSLKDQKLGEMVVLYVEGEIDIELSKSLLKKHLDKYQVPKQIIQKNKFNFTPTGKIIRKTSTEE